MKKVFLGCGVWFGEQINNLGLKDLLHGIKTSKLGFGFGIWHYLDKQEICVVFSDCTINLCLHNALNLDSIIHKILIKV